MSASAMTGLGTGSVLVGSHAAAKGITERLWRHSDGHSGPTMVSQLSVHGRTPAGTATAVMLYRTFRADEYQVHPAFS